MLYKVFNRFGPPKPVMQKIDPVLLPYEVYVVMHRPEETRSPNLVAELGLYPFDVNANVESLNEEQFNQFCSQSRYKRFMQGEGSSKACMLADKAVFVLHCYHSVDGKNVYVQLHLPRGNIYSFEKVGYCMFPKAQLLSGELGSNIEQIVHSAVEKNKEFSTQFERYQTHVEDLGKATIKYNSEKSLYDRSQYIGSFLASVLMFGALGVMLASAGIAIGLILVTPEELFSVMTGLDHPGAGAVFLIGLAGAIFPVVGCVASFCSDSLRDFLYKPSEGISNFACKFVGFGMLAMTVSAIVLLATQEDLEQYAKITIVASFFVLALIVSIVATYIDDKKCCGVAAA